MWRGLSLLHATELQFYQKETQAQVFCGEIYNNFQNS